jgi:hypothetical protein
MSPRPSRPQDAGAGAQWPGRSGTGRQPPGTPPNTPQVTRIGAACHPRHTNLSRNLAKLGHPADRSPAQPQRTGVKIGLALRLGYRAGCRAASWSARMASRSGLGMGRARPAETQATRTWASISVSPARTISQSESFVCRPQTSRTSEGCTSYPQPTSWDTARRNCYYLWLMPLITVQRRYRFDSEVCFWHTSGMSKMEPLRRQLEPSPSHPNDRAIEAIVSAIDTLVDGLTAADKEKVFRKITEKLRPFPVPQAGDVLGIVVQLIPRDRQWTVAEIKRRIEEAGADVPEKAIHNAIGYLARRQHIQRLGYGRYMIGGVPVVTTDELGGQRSITEQDLDD